MLPLKISKACVYLFSKSKFLAPPPPPTDLMITDKTDRAVTLAWYSPSDLNPQFFSGYYIERCLEGTDDWVKCNAMPIRAPKYTVRSISMKYIAAKIVFRLMTSFVLYIKRRW